MELNWEVVSDPYSTLSLHKCINRRREVHERGLELLHCYAGGIGTLIPPTFALDVIPLCCKAWRLSSLEKRSRRTRSRFHEVPSKRRWHLYFFHLINKDVILFLFHSMCLIYWISNYDLVLMLIRLGFDVSLITIALHVIILVWGRYNVFCRSLGERGARGGLKGCLDQPSFE